MQTVKREFQSALNREGRTIYHCASGTEINCLFRRCEDSSNTTNKVIIFYNTDSPIEQGNLIKYKDKYFLSLNQESIENEVYHKSTLIMTNTIVKTIVNSTYVEIPVYTGELFSYTPNTSDNGTTIKVADGSLVLMTESNSDTKSIVIDNKFNVAGANYKVINTIHKDGICTIYVVRNSSEVVDNYTFGFDLDTTYKAGDTYAISCNGTINTLSVNIDVSDVVFTSSDNNVATISNNVISFIGIGEVLITGTWNGIIVTKSTMINENTNADIMTVTYENITKSYEGYMVRCGISTSFTATFKNASGEVISDILPVWTISNIFGSTLDLSNIVITGADTFTVTLNFSVDTYVAKNIILNVADSENICDCSNQIYLSKSFG